jgi:hypothetical protein
MKTKHDQIDVWLPTGRASQALGISSTTLHRWIAHGFFEEGTHYRNGLTAKSPRRWNCKEVESRISELRKKPPRPNVGGSDDTAGKVSGKTVRHQVFAMQHMQAAIGEKS